MSDGDYRVIVDVDVKKEQLDDVEKKLKSLSGKDQKLSINVDTSKAIKDITALENRVKKLARTINSTKFNLGSFTNMNSGISNKKKQAQSTIDTFQRLLAMQGKMNKASNVAGGLSGDKLVKFNAAIRKTEAEYNRLYATVAKKLNTNQIAQLNSATGSSLPAVKQTINAWNELKRVTKEVTSVSGKLAKLDGNADANKVRELTSQLENAKRAYEDLRNSLKGQLSFSQYEQLNSELTKTENKIKEVEAGILDAKRKMAEKISTGLTAGGDTTKSYNNVEREFRKITEASSDAVSAIERVRAAKQELDSLNNMVGPRTKEDEVAHYEKQIAAQKEYEAAVRSANNIIKENIAIENESAAAAKATATAKEAEAKKTLAAAQLQQKAQNLSLSMDLYRKNNSKIKGTLFDNELKNFQTQLKNCDAITLNNVAGQFDNFKKRVELAGQSGLKFSDRLKMQFTRLSSYFGASSVIMAGIQAARKIFESVRDVDTAMTELKRVTDLSSTQYSDLYSELTVSAREYGTTLKDIINATADWSRAGFDANTAKGLAEVTTMYQHIADVDYQTAFENLETAYKGFETQLKQDFGNDTVAAVSYIGDILNELDNNFAVTADGVGEAIKRSASALSIAGNTIQETAGMVTGITEVTQDPEKAGNALKVLSMRLRGTKGELEDLGEDVDENVTNLTKMQGQVLNLTHGHVDIFGDTGEFKSTYEIMQGIAEIYDELSSVEQADLLETIAGKHRANDVAALISNWDQVASATEHATEATGSAEEEHAKYLDSIQGKLNSLTSVWETFSNTFMNSDLVKGVITALTGVLNVIEKIISTTGIFGTSGILSTLFFGINKRNGIKNIISEFFGNFSAGISMGAKKLDAFKMSLGNTFKNLSTSQKITGTLAGIGVATTILASIATAVEAHKEAQRQARQEIVDTANTFNDSFGSFEQAYIKYADKTVLSADEENELKSAIDGTVNALGDKSSALKEAIGSSSEYINNLSEIAKAELTEQERLAKDAKQAAKENLIETASQTENFGATRLIDIKLPDANSKEYKAVEDLLGETQKHFATRFTNSNWIEFGDLTDIDNMMAKYNSLIDLRDRLNDENLIDNDFYKDISKSIDTLSSGMDEYIKQTYNAEKASYQLKNGIATNEEEFYAMREAILSSASASVDVRSAIGDIMNEQYKDTFDLSSVESKINYIKNVTKDIADIGGKDEATFETLLDLKTKVNNGECSVGDYVSQIQEANDAIGSIENEDAQEFLRVQLGLELDSDGNIKDDIKKTRDKLINDLKNSGVAEDVATSFTDSLSSKELVVAQDLLVDGELDLKHLDSDKVKKQIAELAEHNEALQFNVDIELETENLEKLNTAVSEALSGTGLSSESMIKVKEMFKGLDGYDPSKLFERTANGIRLNTEEFKKMNNEYKNTNIEGLNKKLSALGDEYNKTNEELTNLTYGTDEYKEKASELSGIEAQINAAEELAAQYEGLASKYNEWQQVEAAGSQRDMYESILSGFENVKDEISRGWVDDGTIEFIELLSGKDLSSGNIDKIRDAYESLDETIEGTTYSVKDFFTANEDGESTSDGVYNFLEAVDQKFQDSNIIQKDENGNVIGFDFKVAGGDKAIADALGISEELVQIMVRAADDAGFVVSMDGTFQNLDILKDKAQDAANTLKKMFEGTDKEISTEFNLQTNDENSIMEQYKSALSIWEQFKQNKNADGTINMNVEGAEEAFTLVSTLQSMVDKLSEPAYMSINVSEVDKNMQKPLSELQQYENLTQQEHQLKLKGTDTSEIEKSKGEILDYFQDIQKNQPEISAKLGIDNLSREELEQKLNDGSLEVDAALNLQVEMNDTLRDQVNVALYSAGIIDKEELEKRVDVDVYAENVDTSDVKEKTEEAVENSGDDDSKTETTADVEVKAGDVDTSDVKDKTEEAISDESEKDSTVEKSVDLEVSVEEYKEIIDELNDANKDIEINVKVNGLDDVEKLTSDIDIAAKVDGSVHDLTEYAEAAKQLSDIDDNITKTVSASLYGNLDRNENIGSLQQFIDGAKELEDVNSSFVTVTANFSGNLDENAKSIENMPKFAEGAKVLQGTPSSSVTIEANLKGDGVGNDWLGNNSTLDNIEKFAESAERLRGVGDASVTVEANLKGDGVGDSFWTGDNSALDNLDKFAESAKKLQGVGSADVTVKANLEANGVGDNFFTGNNSALDNLDKFAESAERLNGIEDADVSVKANLDSNIGNDFFSDSNSTLDNLKKFAEGAESLKNVGDVSASVTANLNSSGVADNFFTGSNSVLDNLEKYAEGAEKIKGVGDVSASVSANLTSTGVADNIFGNNSVIDNLSDFADGAEKLKGVEDVSVSIAANLESTGVADNIFGNNSVLDNLDKFAESARNLQGAEDVSVSITAGLQSTGVGDDIFGNNSALDNLDKFADSAKELEGVGNQDVSITANLDGSYKDVDTDKLKSFVDSASKIQDVGDKTVNVEANLKGDIDGNTADNLSAFAEGAKKLQGVGDASSTVTANLKGEGLSNDWLGNNSVLSNLNKFADGAKNLQNVGDVEVKVDAALNATGIAGADSTLSNLDKFADGAKSLSGVEDVDVSVKASLEGSINPSTVDNLEKFADGAKSLKDVEGTSVTVTANLNGNIGDGAFGTANSKLANLSSFVDGAKKLNGVEDKSVTITANINGNVGASSDAINNLPSFASTASTLQNVNSKTVTVTANVSGNITSENVTTLSQFGATVSSLPSSTTVSVNTNVDIEGISNIKSTLQGLSDSGVMHNYSASVTVTTNVDSSGVDSYSPPPKNGTVTYDVDSSKVDAWSAPSKTGTITYTPSVEALTDSQRYKTGTITYKAEVVDAPVVNGTANVNGSANRAFSKGDWGTKDSGVALMGELGQELIVRDGRFFTVGDNGAEFAQYKKGDIIFNHKQTEELFKNGYVTSGGGRGRALVEGTAFGGGSSGHGGWGRPGGGSSSGSSSSSSRSSGSSSNSSSSDDAEEFEETLDWIEIKISRIERAISKLDLKASSVYKKWSTRNAALAEEIGKVSEEIDIQSAGADRYLQQANSIGLSEEYASKVRNGTIDIETIYDENLKDKISDYQTWYEKYLDCIDACEELKEKEAELYHQRFDNVSEEYDGILSKYENWKSVLEEKVNVNETRGYIVSNDYYKELQENEHQKANNLRSERAELIKKRDDAVNSGSIKEGSKDWDDMNNAIDEVTLSIYECQTAWWEYEKTMRETDWKIFDLLQERITNVADETQFLIDLLDNKKLYEDNGQLTDEGMAQMGLHGIKYDTYMYQADKYREEMNKLDKQIAEDPYNQDLINRRQELLKLQQESISAAEDEKNAIKDLVQEGIEKELDSLQKLIDKYNDALDSQKD